MHHSCRFIPLHANCVCVVYIAVFMLVIFLIDVDRLIVIAGIFSFLR